MKKFPVFKEFGEHALLITWENKIDAAVNNHVLVAEKYIKQRFKEVVLESLFIFATRSRSNPKTAS